MNNKVSKIERPSISSPLSDILSFLSSPSVKESYKKEDGVYRTQSLFCEHYNYNPAITYFTNKEQHVERNGIPFYSMKKMYIEFSDPTEYDFAVSVLASYSHWKKMTTKYLASVILSWREELDLKIKAEAIKNMTLLRTRDGTMDYRVLRYLADNEYLRKENIEDNKRKKKISSGMDPSFKEMIQEDLERMGIQ